MPPPTNDFADDDINYLLLFELLLSFPIFLCLGANNFIRTHNGKIIRVEHDGKMNNIMDMERYENEKPISTDSGIIFCTQESGKIVDRYRNQKS